MLLTVLRARFSPMAAALLPMLCRLEATLMAPIMPPRVWACAVIPKSENPRMQNVVLICRATITAQADSVNGFDGKISLFADAKLAENRVEQILGGRLADHFTDRVGGES